MKRNRKLTWIEKYRINKIAFDHPYFDMPGTTLSDKEVDQVIRTAPSKKTGKEIIAEAYVKADIPLTEQVTEDHSSLSGRILEIFTMRTLKKAVAITLACISLVIFFAFTSIGRSVAETVYQIIVDIIDGAIYAHNEPDDSESSTYDFTTLPSGIDNPYDLAKRLDYPIIISNKDEMVSFTMEIESKHTILLFTEYRAPTGVVYTLLQEIYSSNTLWGSTSSSGDVRELDTSFGLHLYVVSDNSSSSILGYTENYSLDIAVEGSFETVEEIVKALDIAE